MRVGGGFNWHRILFSGGRMVLLPARPTVLKGVHGGAVG